MKMTFKFEVEIEVEPTLNGTVESYAKEIEDAMGETMMIPDHMRERGILTTNVAYTMSSVGIKHVPGVQVDP